MKVRGQLQQPVNGGGVLIGRIDRYLGDVQIAIDVARQVAQQAVGQVGEQVHGPPRDEVGGVDDQIVPAGDSLNQIVVIQIDLLDAGVGFVLQATGRINPQLRQQPVIRGAVVTADVWRDSATRLPEMIGKGGEVRR